MSNNNEYPDIYNNVYEHVYENVSKKILDEFMQYTFFENNQKTLVLDKEKIKQKYNVQNVIFEEEDITHE